jgi:hypothetical protein
VQNSYSRNAQRRGEGEAQQFYTTGPRHRRRGGSGPPENRPGEGGHEVGPPRWGRNQSVDAPPSPPPGPTLLLWLYGGAWRQFPVVSPFTSAKPSYTHYKTRPRALLSIHIIWSFTLHHLTCILFIVLVLVIWARQSYQGKLVSLEEVLLGMNTSIKSSSKFMLSYSSYSSAYELEYSLDHVIIMIYELAYSLYTIILTCSSLFFNFNIIFMSRIRVKLRWRFIMPSGVPKSFTCRSVGSRTRGDLGSFYICKHGAWDGGTGEYISLSTVEG